MHLCLVFRTRPFYVHILLQAMDLLTLFVEQIEKNNKASEQPGCLAPPEGKSRARTRSKELKPFDTFTLMNTLHVICAQGNVLSCGVASQVKLCLIFWKVTLRVN